jgi:hypothetical protein
MCCARLASEDTEEANQFLQNAAMSKSANNQNNCLKTKSWPCRSSGGQPPASHHGGPGSSPAQVVWDLWRTERHWGRFPPCTSVSPATNCSTIITIYHPGLVQQANKWPQ